MRLKDPELSTEGMVYLSTTRSWPSGNSRAAPRSSPTKAA